MLLLVTSTIELWAQNNERYKFAGMDFIQNSKNENRFDIYKRREFVGYYIIDQNNNESYDLYDTKDNLLGRQNFTDDENNIGLLSKLTVPVNEPEPVEKEIPKVVTKQSSSKETVEGQTTQSIIATTNTKPVINRSNEDVVTTPKTQPNYDNTPVNPNRYKITREVIIPEGTILRVRSLSSFSSKNVAEGDIVDFQMLEDLIIDGELVIREGAMVVGLIQEAERARGLGKEGMLKIDFSYTKAIDGTKIPLKSTRGTIEGQNKLGGAIALAVVVTPLFLFKKGKNAQVFEGKIMQAYVSRDVKLGPKN